VESRPRRWARPLALAAALGVPAAAIAHERWVKRVYLPFDKAYFQHMTGQVLRFSLGAALAVTGVVTAWYLLAVPIVDKLTPHSAEDREREARRPAWQRLARFVVRFLLDADEDNRFMEVGERLAAGVFQRLPAAVLALGAIQGWFVMPSFPLHDPTGPYLKGLSIALALWVLVGRQLRALGVAMFFGFAWLSVDYGSAAVDAIPVLASAFYYFYADDPRRVNARQLAGMRVSLGAGFFLLGLINKIYHAELFIAVGDAFPELVRGSQKMFPWITRESWSFTTALGEMTFGLLLLLGLFDKLTTLALTIIFANFIFIFGAAEIVHIYPIVGFLVLFFHAPPGTLLDGAVFRSHVKLWSASGHSTSPILYPLAVGVVAVLAGALLMFGPLFFVVHVLPRL
jgi:uncharacterized membrane protein YphA (DoxX/SURF4 family)